MANEKYYLADAKLLSVPGTPLSVLQTLIDFQGKFLSSYTYGLPICLAQAKRYVLFLSRQGLGRLESGRSWPTVNVS